MATPNAFQAVAGSSAKDGIAVSVRFSFAHLTLIVHTPPVPNKMRLADIATHSFRGKHGDETISRIFDDVSLSRDERSHCDRVPGCVGGPAHGGVPTVSAIEVSSRFNFTDTSLSAPAAEEAQAKQKQTARRDVELPRFSGQI